MVRRSILLLLFFGFAQPSFGISCVSKDGKKVNFRPISSKIIGEKGFAVAIAGRNKFTDKRFVYYDLNLLQTPKSFRRFSLYHDCGHHVLGHILPSSRPKLAIHASREEHDADCYAKRRVEKEGGNMQAVYDTLRDTKRMRMLGADLNPAYARAKQIQSCK